MKTTTCKLTLATAVLGLATLMSNAQPTVPAPPTPPPAQPPIVNTPPPAPAMPVAPAPGAPGVSVNIGVPDSYVWDGYEYVGVIGNQYYYLAPGNVWMPLPQDRYTRFYSWERDHNDWRTHATRNELYRRDAQGHEHPWKNDRDHEH